MRLRCAAHKRAQSYSDHAGHAEDRHWKTSVFGASPYVCRGVGKMSFDASPHMQVHIPVIVPPTMLMLTELAPPPKKRVTIKVAKFGAVAEGMSQICPEQIERVSGMYKGVTTVVGLRNSPRTKCTRRSSQAYDPYSLLTARTAAGKLPRLRSRRQLPSTAMGSWLEKCQTLLPSARYQTRRLQRVSLSEWSCRHGQRSSSLW